MAACPRRVPLCLSLSRRGVRFKLVLPPDGLGLPGYLEAAAYRARWWRYRSLGHPPPATDGAPDEADPLA
jgi:hypothetical protein